MNNYIDYNAILKDMTLEEKAGLCSGRDYWTTKPIYRMNVPSARVSDGPHGLRLENEDSGKALNSSYPATSFPPAVNLASSWDTSLAYLMGEELAKQCLDQGVSVILGPGVNIKRSPLCGRNFEYMSEDPYLSSRMCVNYINGVQSRNVGTSLKHFCVNNQETRRMTINAVVDERALREIYLPSFECAVKEAKPWTVMCSYNQINGEYASDNKRILTDILREEWGFKGLVVSDWNATNNRVKGIQAGLDLEMPYSGGVTDKQIIKAVKSGQLKEKDLDKVVLRLLKFIFKCDSNQRSGYSADYENAHNIARKIAEASAVLLKNDDNALPIAESDDIALIGELARTSRYQGSGSSRINPIKLVSLLDALTQNGRKFEFAPGYTISNEVVNQEMIQEAVALASRKEKVIVAIGLTDDFECEGYDRSHIDLPESHNALIEAVTAVNSNVTVILYGGSPVAMPWIDKVKAVLNAYLPGEAGGEAIHNIIYGEVSPSGKLAETYPVKLDDYIGSQYFKMGPRTVEHRESIFVGYRYYDSANKEVLFPFGHGLSYTTFAYSGLEIKGRKVTFTVTNTGDYDGADVCQLYVRAKGSRVFRADKELKSFAKVFLRKGQSVKVEMNLDDRSFAFYNTEIKDWYVENCDYDILIGSSSRDIRLSGSIKITDSVIAPMPDYESNCPCYYKISELTEIPSEQFSGLYGKELPSNRPAKRGEFDLNTTFGDLACCHLGRLILKVAPGIIKGQVDNPDMTTMLMLMQGMKELPLRGLVGMSGGNADLKLIRGLVEWGNKHRLKGLFMIIGGGISTIANFGRQKQLNETKKQERLIAKQKAQEAKAEAKAKAQAAKAEAKANRPTMSERLSNFRNKNSNNNNNND